jgi:hypothetical protein
MQRLRVKDWDPNAFPALYRCADHASISAQKWYLRWIAFNLAVLVLGALTGSIGVAGHRQQQLVHFVAAVCFVLAVGATILLAFRRWNTIWYAGRAVAESVKSLTWKFIASADPFSTKLSESEAVEMFTKALGELLDENRHLSSALILNVGDGAQVTTPMRQWRTAQVSVLRDLYVSQRVDDQQRWYATSARKNKRYQNYWFAFLVLCQGAAGCAAILLVFKADLTWKASGFFSTLASVALAWGQIKRFQDLAQAYGYAAQELSLISARSPHVGTPEELGRFVNDAETAISREHSSWIARRETR